MRNKPFLLNLILSTVLFITILLPRALELDRMVTPDEPTWLTASANFYTALARGEFQHTYQLEHPGVTTMWMGTLAFLWKHPGYTQTGPGQIEWWLDEVGPVLQRQGRAPLEMLAASRLIMVIAVSLVLAAAFRSAARLLGLLPALLGFGLIALDPFLIAHSRLLHQDGLLSALMLLSVLGLLDYLICGGNRSTLALSGAAAGLAWLTKSPTLFLIPFAFLGVLLHLIRKGSSPRRLTAGELRWAGKTLAVWGAAGLAVFILLWPAMWVKPFESVWYVLRAMAGYAAGGHEAPIFFNGSVIAGDPGLLFYPLNYAWRTTPFVLAGLALTLTAAAVPTARREMWERRYTLAGLALFVLLFTVYMSLGAKKFDRYLLPVFAPLDLIAGAGWVFWLQWLAARWPLARAAGGLAVMLCLVLQGWSVVTAFPYYLSYYNPLLGGTQRAPKVMMVGWGEGLDQAAQYLNRLPGAPDLQVAAGVWNGTFSYFFQGQVVKTPFLEAGQEAGLSTADFCIVYINQRQRRRLPGGLEESLSALKPVYTVQLQKLDYVEIYDLRSINGQGSAKALQASDE